LAEKYKEKPPTPPLYSRVPSLQHTAGFTLSRGQELSSNLFPRSWLQKDELNFSFSGVKSSVKREVDKRIEKSGELTLEDKQEIAYEFQEAVTEVLATKLVNATEKYNTKTVMLA
jgi:N6-L-threonylcarbamoyladenine synthase